MQLIKTIVNKFVTIWNRSERNHIDHYGMKPLQRLKRSLGEEQTMKKTNVACYTNRELSWLSFNERVLDEAANARVPLAERLLFASIYQTNLDEFYMVRVGTLMTQMNSKEKIFENKTGMSSEEQVCAILKRTRELEKKKAKTTLFQSICF